MGIDQYFVKHVYVCVCVRVCVCVCVYVDTEIYAK